MRLSQVIVGHHRVVALVVEGTCSPPSQRKLLLKQSVWLNFLHIKSVLVGPLNYLCS